MVVLNWSWLRIVVSSSWPGAEVVLRDRVDGEACACPIGVVKRPFARAVGQVEAARLAHARVVLREPGHDVLDVVADAVVVVDRAPASRRCCGCPSVACAIRPTMAGSLSRCSEAGGSTPRDMWTTPVVSSTVTNCSPDACTSRLGAAEAGKDQRLLAGDQVGAIELGRDLHRQPAARDRLRRVVRVGRRGEEVAAQPDEHLHPPLVHRLDGLHGVEAVRVAAARS